MCVCVHEHACMCVHVHKHVYEHVSLDAGEQVKLERKGKSTALIGHHYQYFNLDPVCVCVCVSVTDVT